MEDQQNQEYSDTDGYSIECFNENDDSELEEDNSEFARSPRLINQHDFQQFNEIQSEYNQANNLTIFSNQQNDFIDVAAVQINTMKVWRIQKQQKQQNCEIQPNVAISHNIASSNENLKDTMIDQQKKLENAQNFCEQILFLQEFPWRSHKSIVTFSPYGKTLVLAQLCDHLNRNQIRITIFQRESLEQRFSKVCTIAWLENQGFRLTQLVCGKWGSQNLFGVGRTCYGNPSIIFLNISDAKIQKPKDVCIQFDRQDTVLCNCTDWVQVTINDNFQKSVEIQNFMVPALKAEHKVQSFCFSKQGDLFVIATKSNYLQLHFANSNTVIKLFYPRKREYDQFTLNLVTLNISGTMLACWNSCKYQVCVWKRFPSSSFDFEVQALLRYDGAPCTGMEFSQFDDNLLLHAEGNACLNLTYFIGSGNTNKIRQLVHQRIPQIAGKNHLDKKIYDFFGLRSSSEGDIFVGCEESLFKWSGIVLPRKYGQAMEVFSAEIADKYGIPSCVTKKIKELALHPIGVWVKPDITRFDIKQKHVHFNVGFKYKDQPVRPQRKRKRLRRF